MKIKILLILSVAVAAMFFASPVFGVELELDGRWIGSITTPDGDEYPLDFTFKVDGNKLTGTSSHVPGDQEIQDGKVTGDDFSFWILAALDVKVIFTGKLHDHVCEINMDYDGYKAKTTLKKVPDK